MNFLVFRGLLAIAALACWSLVAFDSSFGADYLAEDRAVVESGEVIDDDLYIFGDEVRIDGDVKGDVVAFGRVIRLNGTVEGDFIAAAQAIIITGKIADDARIAGQVIKIDENATIGDDLICAALSLECTNASTIDADLVYAGYQALLAGEIGGDVSGGVANCEVAGHIGGDVKFSIDGDEAGAQTYSGSSPLPITFPDVPAGLTIRDSARIDGAMKYTSRTEANIENGAQIVGAIEHELPQVEGKQSPTVLEIVIGLVGQYVSLLIIGLCFLWVAPTWTQGLAENVKTRPLASFGIGAAGMVSFFIVLITILIGTIFLAVVAGFLHLSGLIPAVIVLGISSTFALIVSFWFLAAYLAEIVVSVVAGRWLLNLAKPSLGENRFLSFPVGLVLFSIIYSVPYLGSLIGWLAVLFVLGALLLRMFRKRSTESMPIEKTAMAE